MSAEALKKNFSGKIVFKGEEGYDEAREPKWNSLNKAQPSVVLFPKTVDDIKAALTYARETKQKVTVSTGAGHSFYCQQDGAVKLDVSHFNSVSVDVEKKQVTVGGGVKLGEVDAETTKHNLYVPMGIVSHTGIGLALGGGVGWTCRLHGLTADNLLRAKVVTGNGDFVEASETEHPDLFLSLRGGAGFTGVVTELTFKAFPLEGMPWHATLGFPQAHARDILKLFGSFVNDPEKEKEFRATAYMMMTFGPDGSKVILTALTFMGPAEEAEKFYAPFLSLGGLPLHRGPLPYTALQQALDKQMGKRNWYQSTASCLEFNDAIIDRCMALTDANEFRHAGALVLEQRGGQFKHADASKTLIRDRHSLVDAVVFAGWDDPAISDEKVKVYRGWKEELVKGQLDPTGINLNMVDKVDIEKVALKDLFLTLKNKYDTDHLLLSGYRFTKGE